MNNGLAAEHGCPQKYFFGHEYLENMGYNRPGLLQLILKEGGRR
jgi:hypothetical protein